MALGIHQLAAGLYLGAAVAAALGLVLPAPRLTRGAVVLLAAGAAAHGLGFLQLHTRGAPPALTTLPAAVSLTAWLGSLFFLALQLRGRLAGLAVLVAPAAFLGTFFESLWIAPESAAAHAGSPLWSHLHVLLASGGLALLGVAGFSGCLYVAHHRSIKSKRPGALRVPLPSLEALDRVNVLALAAGFLLLTLGLLSGVLWVHADQGRLWPGSIHANVTLAAWAVYALVVGARFGAHQGARQSALSSAAGFAFLLFAVVGVGILA